MTNLLSLPQIPPGTSIVISSNADFIDEFFISTPNFISSPVLITATISNGSYTVTGIASTTGLVPGMAVTGFGIPSGTIIAPGGVSVNSITLNNEATQTVTGLQLTILPPPLDLTGINFSSILRRSVTDPTALILMTTQNGLMTNGAQAGTFGWNVPVAKLPSAFAVSGTGVLNLLMGIHATDTTGVTIDLCAENGPIPVTVNISAA